MLLSSNLSLSHFPSPLSLSLFLQGIDIYRIAQEDAAFALNLVSYDMQQLVTVYIRWLSLDMSAGGIFPKRATINHPYKFMFRC